MGWDGGMMGFRKNLSLQGKVGSSIAIPCNGNKIIPKGWADWINTFKVRQAH